MNDTKVTILASDIGSRNNGIAIIKLVNNNSNPEYITAYNHRLEAQLMSDRLLDLYNVLNALVENYQVTDITYENPVVRGRNGIDLQHICAIHKLVVAQHKLGFKDFTATAVKKAVTNNGGADKFVVAKRACEILELPEDKVFDKGNHDSDALAIALTYAKEIYKIEL